MFENSKGGTMKYLIDFDTETNEVRVREVAEYFQLGSIEGPFNKLGEALKNRGFK